MPQDSGLADYLSQHNNTIRSGELSQFIHSTGIDYIDFMPCGEYPRNPASLLSDECYRVQTLTTHIKLNKLVYF